MASVRYTVNDVDAAATFRTDCPGFEIKQQSGPAIALFQPA